MSFRRRLGQFLGIIGAFLVGLYIFSDITGMPDYGLLGGGVVLLALGILLVVGNPKPPPEPNPRFRLLNRLRKKAHKEPAPQRINRRSRTPMITENEQDNEEG